MLVAAILALQTHPPGIPGIGCAPAFSRETDTRVVWKSAENGYHTYRIPALAVTARGTVLAFCEGRKEGRNDYGDIDLLFKRSTDHGSTWSRQSIVWNDAGNTCGNPCPIIDRTTGTVWLLLTWNLGGDRESEIIDRQGRDIRRVFITSSPDDGRTWAKPREITAGHGVWLGPPRWIG